MAAPVAYGLIGRVLQSLVAAFDRKHFSSQHLHALHVDTLALNVQRSHVDTAGHIHQGAYGGSCHTVLTSPRLSDDTFLAHLACKQDLTDGIVDLVSSSMIQVLALQVKLAPVFRTHPLGEIERAGTTDIVAKQLVILIQEIFTFYDGFILVLQILHCLVENLRHIRPAK